VRNLARPPGSRLQGKRIQPWLPPADPFCGNRRAPPGPSGWVLQHAFALAALSAGWWLGQRGFGMAALIARARSAQQVNLLQRILSSGKHRPARTGLLELLLALQKNAEAGRARSEWRSAARSAGHAVEMLARTKAR